MAQTLQCSEAITEMPKAQLLTQGKLSLEQLYWRSRFSSRKSALFHAEYHVSLGGILCFFTALKSNQFIQKSNNYSVLGWIQEPLTVPDAGYIIPVYQWKLWVVSLGRAVTQLQDVWVTDKPLTVKVT